MSSLSFLNGVKIAISVNSCPEDSSRQSPLGTLTLQIHHPLNKGSLSDVDRGRINQFIAMNKINNEGSNGAIIVNFTNKDDARDFLDKLTRAGAMVDHWEREPRAHHDPAVAMHEGLIREQFATLPDFIEKRFNFFHKQLSGGAECREVDIAHVAVTGATNGGLHPYAAARKARREAAGLDPHTGEPATDRRSAIAPDTVMADRLSAALRGASK